MMQMTTQLIEIKAGRYSAAIYVAAVMTLSAVLIGFLGWFEIIDLASSWQWLLPVVALSSVAWWYHKKHTVVFRLDKVNDRKIICSLIREHESIEEQIASIDYWKGYKPREANHRIEMHVVQYLQIETISGSTIRFSSNMGEGIIDASLLRVDEFGLMDTVYVIDDVGEIVTVLKKHLPDCFVQNAVLK